jgi:hypothetical protein
MDQNNFDELNDLLDQANRQTGMYSGLLGNNLRENTILNQVDRQRILLEKQELQLKKIRTQSLKMAAGTLVSMTASLTTSESSFKPVTAAIQALGRAINKFASTFGTIGKIIGTVAEGMADATNWMIETFEKNYGNFERLSETGLFDTFDSLRDVSKNTMLTFNTLNNVLSKQSKNLALYGTTALKGGQEFKRLAAAGLHNRERFFSMGIGIEEYAETQADYLAFMSRISNSEQTDMRATSMGHVQYLENIIQLSKQTGVTRKELQNQLNDLTRDARFRAWSQGRSAKEVERANKLIATVSVSSPEMAKGFKDAIAAGGNIAANSDEFLKLMITYSHGNSDLINMVDMYLKGMVSFDDFIQDFSKTSGSAADRLQGTVSQIGDVQGFSNYYELRRAQQIKPLEEQQDISGNKINSSINQVGTLTTEKDRNLSRTRIRMNDMGVMTDLLATEGSFVLNSFSKLTGGLNSVIEEAYKFLGQPIPVDVQLLNQQQRLMTDLTSTEFNLAKDNEKRLRILQDMESLEVKKQQGDITKDEDLQLKILEKERNNLEDQISIEFKEIGDKKNKINEIINRRNSLGSNFKVETLGDILTGASGGSSSGLSNAPVKGDEKRAMEYFIARGWTIDQAAGIVGNLIQESNLNPKALNQRENAQGIAQWRLDRIENVSKFLGKPLLESSFEEQLSAVDWELNNGEKRAGYRLRRATNAAAAARIVDKYYERSAGTEIQNRIDNAFRLLNSASTNSVPEARTGGIFSGPNTGYLAMLHGDEMVIPANNDIVKQNLQNSVFSSGSDNELMVDFFEMMNEQVEKMIDMISDVNSSQRLYSKI